MHMYNMHNISKKKCTPHFIRLYYRHQLNNGFQHFLIFMFYIFWGGGNLSLKQDYLSWRLVWLVIYTLFSLRTCDCKALH